MIQQSSTLLNTLDEYVLKSILDCAYAPRRVLFQEIKNLKRHILVNDFRNNTILSGKNLFDDDDIQNSWEQYLKEHPKKGKLKRNKYISRRIDQFLKFHPEIYDQMSIPQCFDNCYHTFFIPEGRIHSLLNFKENSQFDQEDQNYFLRRLIHEDSYIPTYAPKDQEHQFLIKFFDPFNHRVIKLWRGRIYQLPQKTSSIGYRFEIFIEKGTAGDQPCILKNFFLDYYRLM